jgi:hypothetical protein
MQTTEQRQFILKLFLALRTLKGRTLDGHYFSIAQKSSVDFSKPPHPKVVLLAEIFRGLLQLLQVKSAEPLRNNPRLINTYPQHPARSGPVRKIQVTTTLKLL